MKNILISLFSIFIIFACSSTPVEKVDVQETKTVDLTESSQTDSNDSVMMSDLDFGEAYVTVLFDYDDDTLRERVFRGIVRCFKFNEIKFKAIRF